MARPSKARIMLLVFIMEAILSLSFFNLYADTVPKPQRPYYTTTPKARHIQNNDRLTADYFNNQLNVIYNWAQNINQELDDLLHNGNGVASLTVGLLKVTDKIINPEWDALLHNGQGVASVTADLVKARNLDISNQILVPSIEFTGASQPNASNIRNGYLYYDTSKNRFRVYQQGAWRDLSSNFVIEGTTLTNPLVINGYLEASNVYTTNTTVNSNLEVKGEATAKKLVAETALKVPTVADKTLGKGSVYYDATTGKLKVLNANNQWEIVGEVSQAYVDDKIQEAKDYAVEQDTAMLQVLTDLATNNLEEAKGYASQQANNAQSSSNSYAEQQANLAKSYAEVQANLAKTYAEQQASTALSSAKTYSNSLANSTEQAYKKLATSTLDAAKLFTSSNYSPNNHNHDSAYVSAVATGDSNGQIKVTKNGSATNVSVKGLKSAAYTESSAYATAGHNHDSSYVSAVATGSANGTIAVTKNGSTTYVKPKGLGSAAYTESSAYATAGHNHDSAYAPKTHNHDSAYAAKDHTHSNYVTSSVLETITSSLTSNTEVTRITLYKSYINYENELIEEEINCYLLEISNRLAFLLIGETIFFYPTGSSKAVHLDLPNFEPNQYGVKYSWNTKHTINFVFGYNHFYEYPNGYSIDEIDVIIDRIEGNVIKSKINNGRMNLGGNSVQMCIIPSMVVLLCKFY